MRTIPLATATLLLASCAHTPAPTPQPPGNATQLIVVTTKGWDSIPGTLRRFVRTDVHSAWRLEGAAIPIVVGKTGLAWGVGFDGNATSSEPHKREGDGRSPAGVFAVDTAFGFAPADSARWVRLNYIELTPTVECVDDTASVHYNTVLDRNSVPAADWTSSEHMRKVGQYKIGAIIDYNGGPPVKGRGSCIFFHIWGGPRKPTVGCTAMEESNLQQLLAWLDPRSHPVVVQVPAEVYPRIRDLWKLPRL